MTLQRRNRAIANHSVDGLGPFNCAGYHVVEGRDSSGASRTVIVFDLAPVEDENAGTTVEEVSSKAPLTDLRRLAFEAGRKVPLSAASIVSKNF
jgi:hypothetical protein